jgi:RimJ/RimL family protein N-acetyltransferase
MHPLLLEIPVKIETDRLILRPYSAGDGPCLFDVIQRNREHFQRYESGNILMRIQNGDDAEVVARELAALWAKHDCFLFGMWEKNSGKWAGQIYIGPIDWKLPSFEIGYVADVEHEGHGFASEGVKASLRMVFEEMGAHRVQLHCDDTNERSVRVAERCGFAREGHLREDKRRNDGSIGGTFVYGMLRPQ